MTGPWISGVQVADPRVAATSRVKQYQLRIVDRSSDIPPGIQATPAPNRCYWPKWFSSGAGCTGGRIRARVRQAAPDIGGGEGARRAAQMGGDRRGACGPLPHRCGGRNWSESTDHSPVGARVRPRLDGVPHRRAGPTCLPVGALHGCVTASRPAACRRLGGTAVSSSAASSFCAATWLGHSWTR